MTPARSNITHIRTRRSTEPIDAAISKVGLFITGALAVAVKKICFGVAVRECKSVLSTIQLMDILNLNDSVHVRIISPDINRIDVRIIHFIKYN